MQRLLSILNIDTTAAMACGDGVNDIEMLQLVARGVAMGISVAFSCLPFSGVNLFIFECYLLTRSDSSTHCPNAEVHFFPQTNEFQAKVFGRLGAGDAHPLAQAAADVVVAAHNNDGVAEAIERYVL